MSHGASGYFRAIGANRNRILKGERENQGFLFFRKKSTSSVYIMQSNIIFFFLEGLQQTKLVSDRCILANYRISAINSIL